MTSHTAAARKRWQATIIITLFILAVAGAAFTGWRFARESAPHQGPIVLVSVDGLRADRLPAYGGRPGATPNIDAFASRGIVFERAYTHSPQTLPAHAALMSGQLPFDNGVRDEGGFTLGEQSRTIATLLRNRGFNTGAAVSSFLLRRSTGLAQGFAFYDADIPDVPLEEGVLPERDGLATFDAASRWIQSQTGQRYFLFLEVDARSADAVIGRLVDELKRTKRYTDATIILTSDHGDASSGVVLDDSSLRVPFIVKQPGEAGAGRRVPLPIQHVDVLPTLLDLVRAPMPSGLRGRSLRTILDKTSGFVPDQPIYAEYLAPQLRFGGQPLFAVSNASYRYVRGVGQQIRPLVDDAPKPDSTRLDQMSAVLDKFLQGHTVAPARPVAQMDEDGLAAYGYLPALSAVDSEATLDAPAQAMVLQAQRSAATLVAQKRYAAALDELRAIAGKHPELVSIRYQVAMVLARTGRVEDAIKTLAAIAVERPNDVHIPLESASLLLRARRIDEAGEQADRAVMLADAGNDASLKAAAHEAAARVALSREDMAAATEHAAAAQKADQHLPMTAFVAGRLAYDAGNYDDALVAFKEAATTTEQAGSSLAELHLGLGNTYARLDRYAEAEAEFREELREFPHNVGTYVSLAMLYHASNRDQAVEHVISDLVEAAPTPEGYSMAARLWTIVGERARAEALRSDARRRFRGDPSLALFGRSR